METARIQGISAYQMQVQALSSKVNEYTKSGDNNSLSMASALRQQMNAIQGTLSKIQTSNNNAAMSTYNSKAKLEVNGVGQNFDKYF